MMRNAAEKYAKLGYKVFPLAPGLKRPHGGLVPHGVSQASNDVEKVQDWFTREPSANLGLACTGLIVIDCDLGNTWPGFERLKSEGHAAVQNTPSGGMHFLFRLPEEKAWGNSQGRLAKKIDTRSNGGYIVVAPSRMIECADDKTVTGDYFFKTPLPAFVELRYPPEWLTAELDKCFATKKPELFEPRSLSTPGSMEAIERAKLYLDACDPAISGQGGHNQTFKTAQALVNGFCLEPDEALNLLKEHYNPRCEPPWSERELIHKVDSALKNPSDKPRGWLRDEGLEAQEGLAKVDIHYLVNAENDNDDDIVPEDYDPGDFPEPLLEVPGFIGDMARFITETNYTYQPVLSLAGALSFQGFLAGRKVRDQSNTRTNVYCLGVVETCCGKERSRGVCKELLAENGEQAKAMFFERPASYQGLQKKVAKQPQCILLWDEIGQALRTYRKADRSPHLQGIIRTVTEFYTSAGNIYCSDTHSDEKNDYTILQPNLVVYGTSTQDELFAGLTLDSIRNGFCGRMLLFEGNDEPDDIDQDILPPPPKELVRATGEWLKFMPPANNLNQVAPNPLVVARTKDAKLVLGELLEQQRQSRRHDDPIHRALWGRAVQKANQLALIYACSEYGPDKRRLQINRYAAMWACDLVRYTTEQMLHMASGWIAEDDFHDKQNEVVRFVRGQKGSVSQNAITRRFQRWSIRVRNEVIQNLLATKQLVTRVNPTTGRGTWFFIPSKAPRTVNEPSARR